VHARHLRRVHDAFVGRFGKSARHH
jgi:hypothetical protein